jgi:hypothetical protein
MSNINRKELIKLLLQMGERLSMPYSLKSLKCFSDEALLREAAHVAFQATQYILKANELKNTDDIYLLIRLINDKIKHIKRRI